jgi:16S rRNA (uracil1498-N3)-methyltransferase
LPKLNDAIPLKEVLLGDEEIKCIAWCEEQSEKIALASALQKDKKTIILIGPEGDFTTEEVHLCIEHNCKTVSLGDTRLRTETAGLYACVVYNSLL